VYDCFDHDAHTTPPFDIPPNWRRYLGVDFGGVNTAAVYIAEDPRDNQLYVYREYWSGNRTARTHAIEMLRDEPGIPTAVGGSKSEGQWRDEFRAAGLPIREPLVSDVAVGISRVYSLIKANKLKVFDTCDRLLDQLQSYAYKTDAAGKPTEEIEDKSSYHLADALRYIATLLGRSTQRVTPESIIFEPPSRSVVGSMPRSVFGG
jgi:phage terminase large subunit